MGRLILNVLINAFIRAIQSTLMGWWHAIRLGPSALRSFIIDGGRQLHRMCFPVTVYIREEQWRSDEIMLCAAVSTVSCSFIICRIKDLDIYPDIFIFNLLSQFAYFMLTNDPAKTLFLCILDFYCSTCMIMSDSSAVFMLVYMEFWTYAHYYHAAPHPIWTAGRCAALGLLARYFRFCVRPVITSSFLVVAVYFFRKCELKIGDFLLICPAISTLIAIILEKYSQLFFVLSYVSFLPWLFVRHML